MQGTCPLHIGATGGQVPCIFLVSITVPCIMELQRTVMKAYPQNQEVAAFFITQLSAPS